MGILICLFYRSDNGTDLSHAAVLTAAAENTAIRVQESLTQRNQVFQAGPGIAVTETEAGRVQGFIKMGFIHITAFLMLKHRAALKQLVL